MRRRSPARGRRWRGRRARRSPFVERYLRKGLEAGVELKALSGATDAAGGYAVPEELDAADRQDADRDLADPRHRQCRQGRLGRLPQARHHRRHAVGLGRRDGGAAGDRHARSSRRSRRRSASSTPIRRRARRCSTTPRSTSRPGWRARSRPSSRGRKARPSSRATAPTSPRASSPRRTATRRTARARSGRCNISRPASPAAFRRRARRTS